MQSPSTANLTIPTRQERLHLWMRRLGHTYKAWGRLVGVSGHALSKLCGQETMPVHRHAQLRELGVPVDLLPKALDIKPGPKPRTPHNEFMTAFLGV